MSYVWDGNYGGIKFPDKRTTVLRIKASGPQRRLYWRATTLDVYNGAGWLEQLDPRPRSPGRRTVTSADDDPLLPSGGREQPSSSGRT